MTTYEPTLCVQLFASRRVDTNRRLYVIYAADGTQLDVIEDYPSMVPLWVTGLIQLGSFDVLPGEYVRVKKAAAATRSTAAAPL